MRIVASRPDPALLTLPWEVPLEQWHEHVVPVPRGLSRHVVRVIRLGTTFYAVKETGEEIAATEYRLLRRLNRAGLPSVVPQAVVRERPDGLEGALVTRHLAFALPYRTLFANGVRPEQVPGVIDALVVLLVRLHLAGFFWGDVSLSNVLFRRSAGEFSAYLVDAETGEFQPSLSAGRREHDVTVGGENVYAELLDLQASSLAEEVTRAIDPPAVVDLLHERYQQLWSELTTPEEFGDDEMWRLGRRIERLNELGFDVEELSMSRQGDHVSIQPRVVEAGHHSRELAELTGLTVEDNQARRLLNDLAAFAAYFGISDRAEAGRQWREDVYDRIAAMIPADLRGRLEPAEVFHEILEHRWLMSERAGHELNIFEVAEDYFAHQLVGRPVEQLPTSAGLDDTDGGDEPGPDLVV